MSKEVDDLGNLILMLNRIKESYIFEIMEIDKLVPRAEKAIEKYEKLLKDLPNE